MIDLFLVICFFKFCFLICLDLNLLNKGNNVILLVVYINLVVIFLFMIYNCLDVMIVFFFYLLLGIILYFLLVVKIKGIVFWRK